MKYPDSDPIGSLEVIGTSAESIELLSQLGPLPDGVIPPNGNGKLLLMPPSLAETTSQLEESLSNFEKAKRKIDGGRTLRRANDFNTAYSILLLEQLRTATRARNISLYRVNEARSLLQPTIWLGDWQNDETPRTFQKGQGIAGKAWETGEVYVSQGDVQDDPQFDKSNHKRSQHVRSIMAVPIFNFDRRLIHVLNLDSYHQNRFGPLLKERIEALQPDVYAKLQALRLADLKDDELILIFFWILHKAIVPSYTMAPQEAGKPAVNGAGGPASLFGGPPLNTVAPARDAVDPADVAAIFTAVRRELSPGVGKPGPSPIRLDRLWAVFRYRENEWISLDEFEVAFADSTEPRKSASSAVSWLNNVLRRWGYNLTIETRQWTGYRLRLRPPR